MWTAGGSNRPRTWKWADGTFLRLMSPTPYTDRETNHGFWKRRTALAARHSAADHSATGFVLASLTDARTRRPTKSPAPSGAFHFWVWRAVSILRHLEMWAELTPDYSLVSRTGEQNARRRRGLFQLAALRLTPLRNATVLSLVLAAFSSFRLVLRKRTISSWPSSSAHAISVP